MKHFFSLLICIFTICLCRAQNIEITTDKTTSLVFPFAIRHVDRGTKEILVQTVKESDNVLLVKASDKTMEQSNLIVVTSDGSVYSFPVQYTKDPKLSIYQIPAQRNASVETYANGIIDNIRTSFGIQDHSWGMLSSVIGIYIKNNIIYYQLRLKNNSTIDYDIDFVRFYIRDKKKGKRTAVQETEIKPVFVAGNIKQVIAATMNTLVFALEKFTIPDAKLLAIEIGESHGGRHLFMKVGNRKIVGARLLPDLK